MKKLLELLKDFAPESRKELVRLLVIVAAGLTVVIDGATDGLDIVNHAIAVLSGNPAGSPIALWSVDCRSELGGFLTIFGADCNACWGSSCPATLTELKSSCDTVIGSILNAIGISRC